MNALSGYKRKTLAGAVTASALLIFEIILKLLLTVFDIRIGDIYDLLRGTGYIAIFMIWGFSLHRRILNKYTRISLEAVACSEVFWIALKSLKYILPKTELLQLHLWYMFYIPMLLIPFFSMLCAVSLGRSENDGWDRRTVIPAIITLALIVLVLTNNHHEFVFSFPPGAAARSDVNRLLSPGIYIVTAWQIICAAAALVIIVSKARIPGRNKVILLPLLPVVLLVIYAAVYSFYRDRLVLLNDLSVIECLLVTSSLELCVATRLIMSNKAYPELFFASGINAVILDDDGGVYASSQDSPDLDDDVLERLNKGIKVIADGKRISSAAIKGGSVVWEEDISAVLTVSDHLRDLSEELQNRDGILKAQYESSHKLSVLEEKNRLYDRMTSETRGRLEALHDSVEAFRDAKSDEESNRALQKCTLLLSYLKRRNNLILISENEMTVDSRELELCIKETCGTLESFGVSCSTVCVRDSSIPVLSAAKIYDLFEDTVEFAFEGLTFLSVVIRDAVSVRLCTAADMSGLSKEGVTVSNEDGDEWLVTISPEALRCGK